MILTSSLILAALQVGPNPNTMPLTDGHSEVRERQVREDDTAPTDPAAKWLAQCLEQLDDDASRAHTLAQVQRNETTGADRVLANHCLGLAATELGRWDDAITAFSAARDEIPAGELRAKARFGSMAGNAALAGGQHAMAEILLTRALLEAGEAASAPLQAIAATDLARALVAQNRPEDALVQLELATQLDPANAESWLLQATLLRRLERLDAAQVAIEAAGAASAASGRGAQAPSDLVTGSAIGLEAGVIAVLSGRDEAARASWQSVIDLAPATDAALTAQDYLAQLGPPSTLAPAQAVSQEPL